MNTEFVDNQYASIYPDGIESHYWTLARLWTIKRVLDCAGAPKARNKAILDLGCGRGIEVNFLRKSGFLSFGLDPGRPSTLPSVEPYVFTGTHLKDLSTEFRAGVHTVLLLDVIEHLPEPQEFFVSMRKQLPSLHQMVVTVPARQEIWTNFDEFNGHFRRYSRESLIAEITSAGGKVVASSYFFHALYLVMRVMKFLQWHRRIVISRPGRPFLHRLLAHVFYLEGLLLPEWLPGTSLVAMVFFEKNRTPGMG